MGLVFFRRGRKFAEAGTFDGKLEKSAEQRASYLVQIPLDKFPRGTYTLQLNVLDPSIERVAFARVLLAIVPQPSRHFPQLVEKLSLSYNLFKDRKAQAVRENGKLRHGWISKPPCVWTYGWNMTRCSFGEPRKPGPQLKINFSAVLIEEVSMRKLRAIVLVVSLALLAIAAGAQDSKPGAPVEINGKALFVIHAGVGELHRGGKSPSGQ